MSAERLARIERLLEGLAIEVERIGEPQRYTAKALNDQSSESHLAALTTIAKPGQD